MASRAGFGARRVSGARANVGKKMARHSVGSSSRASCPDAALEKRFCRDTEGRPKLASTRAKISIDAEQKTFIAHRAIARIAKICRTNRKMAGLGATKTIISEIATTKLPAISITNRRTLNTELIGLNAGATIRGANQSRAAIGAAARRLAPTRSRNRSIALKTNRAERLSGAGRSTTPSARRGCAVWREIVRLSRVFGSAGRGAARDF